MPLGEQRLWTRTLDNYTRASLPEMCVHQNVMATARDNVGLNTKGHIQSHATVEIKILDPAELDDRNSTDHATKTDRLSTTKCKCLLLPQSHDYKQTLTQLFHDIDLRYTP